MRVPRGMSNKAVQAEMMNRQDAEITLDFLKEVNICVCGGHVSLDRSLDTAEAPPIVEHDTSSFQLLILPSSPTRLQSKIVGVLGTHLAPPVPRPPRPYDVWNQGLQHQLCSSS